MKALITGASSGIGREFAKELSKTYSEIIIVARSEDKLQSLKEEISQISNSNVIIRVMDISIKSNCIKLHEEFEFVDLLINNAGFGDFGSFSETSLEKELQMIQTNIVAYHILTKLYLKSMKEKNKGHILNVASIAGFMPGPLMATYYSTKAYIVRLSQAIREELKREKSKVKISILCPGPVDTNFNKVANVRFSIGGLTSEKVVKYTLSNLNKFYIIPGFGVKLARIGAHLAPSSFVAKFVYKIQKKKDGE